MMDVYICESRDLERKTINDSCTGFYLDKNYDGEIYEAGSGNELIRMITDSKLTAVYFVDCSEMSELLMERLWDNSRENFVVLVSDDIRKLLGSISPKLRPSGVLLTPYKAEDVKGILERIFDEYQRESENKLTYRFKVKSRVYSVDIKRIDYFEASSKKMILRTGNQEFEFYKNFESITATLPEFFVRTHKSFLVNMRNVKNVDYKEMWLSFKDGAKAYISRGYKKDVEDYLSKVEG